MDLGLLGADKGALVDIGMDLDVRVVAELERILDGQSVYCRIAVDHAQAQAIEAIEATISRTGRGIRGVAWRYLTHLL
jgi:hypothetical protein